MKVYQANSWKTIKEMMRLLVILNIGRMHIKVRRIKCEIQFQNLINDIFCLLQSNMLQQIFVYFMNKRLAKTRLLAFLKSSLFNYESFLKNCQFQIKLEDFLFVKLYNDVIFIKIIVKMKRLQLLNEQIKQIPPYVDSCFDYLNMSSLITREQNEARLRIRQFVQSEVVPTIDSYVQQAKFPDYLIPKLRATNILDHFLKAPYGKPLSTTAQGMIVAQLARGDAGVCTMVIVQYALVMYTIETLGSEQQKAQYLPKMKNFELIGGWGLTEDKIGSDASNLKTRAQKINTNQYKLNGTKRWIGNGNKDILIVWARNTQNKNVQAFIVQNNKVSGVTSQVIKHKLPLRVVQNCHITLDNVIVDESQKLPKATDFNKGTNAILKHSRVFVCWVAAGICQGVYDNAIKYVSERRQFGQPISGFQLVQQKIVKIMANTQAILLMCYRISKLVDEGKVSIGQIAMVKAWATERAREVAKWGRQVYGGNGIIHSNYAMKALADMEAIYTYEGTYDINTLVAGRQLTGLAAFKK